MILKNGMNTYIRITQSNYPFFKEIESFIRMSKDTHYERNWEHGLKSIDDIISNKAKLAKIFTPTVASKIYREVSNL